MSAEESAMWSTGIGSVYNIMRRKASAKVQTMRSINITGTEDSFTRLIYVFPTDTTSREG
ncbi:hypothetical protein E2C01_006592 [Portunus trituberculatus]|uniref:Uncharacterized protein n=1 Tax=Portunus trituberculatus TaxID=210409 RepID=A0A5B7CYK4_PORTR|nr:hypothetical protein [Portunus trituberculatus]